MPHHKNIFKLSICRGSMDVPISVQTRVEKIVTPETALDALETFPVKALTFWAWLEVPKSPFLIALGSHRFDYLNHINGFSLTVADYDGYKRTAPKEILKGTIPKEVSFYTQVGDGQQGLEQFREYWLPALKERGYRLTSGNVWLTSHRFTGYDCGCEMGDGLTISSRRSKDRLTIELEIEREEDPERNLKVLEWFRGLRTVE